MGDCKFKYVKSKLTHRLEDAQVDQVVLAIEESRFDRSLKTHIDHARRVKELVTEKKKANLCPKCGSSLVIRMAKKGPNAGNEFWGCSGFLRCRYTAPMKNSEKNHMDINS